MENSNKTIREFQIPIIRLVGSHYSEIIDLNDDELILTEPPIFEELSNVEIEQIVFETMKIPECLCHTQCVERYAKLVTEASEAVYGAEKRNGWI